jgi:hypothetical protein
MPARLSSLVRVVSGEGHAPVREVLERSLPELVAKGPRECGAGHNADPRKLRDRPGTTGVFVHSRPVTSGARAARISTAASPVAFLTAASVPRSIPQRGKTTPLPPDPARRPVIAPCFLCHYRHEYMD